MPMLACVSSYIGYQTASKLSKSIKEVNSNHVRKMVRCTFREHGRKENISTHVHMCTACWCRAEAKASQYHDITLPAGESYADLITIRYMRTDVRPEDINSSSSLPYLHIK